MTESHIRFLLFLFSSFLQSLKHAQQCAVLSRDNVGWDNDLRRENEQCPFVPGWPPMGSTGGGEVRLERCEQRELENSESLDSACVRAGSARRGGDGARTRRLQDGWWWSPSPTSRGRRETAGFPPQPVPSPFFPLHSGPSVADPSPSNWAVLLSSGWALPSGSTSRDQRVGKGAGRMFLSWLCPSQAAGWRCLQDPSCCSLWVPRDDPWPSVPQSTCPLMMPTRNASLSPAGSLQPAHIPKWLLY